MQSPNLTGKNGCSGDKVVMEGKQAVVWNYY